MKKIEKVVVESTKVVDAADKHTELLGKQVFVICSSYIYSGELVGSNDKYIVIREPEMVFETGSWHDKSWKIAQRLPCNELIIHFSQIESLGELVR